LAGDFARRGAEHDAAGIRVRTRLVRRAMEWLRLKGAKSVAVSVAYGNDRALDIYAQFGFRPRTVILHEIEPN
jgi:hypothetical protein